MNKIDYVALIIEHLATQNIMNYDEFIDYVYSLRNMNMQGLADELTKVERNYEY